MSGAMMVVLLLVLLQIPYPAAFFAVVRVPRRRQVVFLFIGLGLYLALLAAIEWRVHPQAAWFFVAMVSGGLAGWGMVGGVLTRVALFWLARRFGGQRSVRVGTIVLGFVLLPLLATMPVVRMLWLERSPSAACLEGKHRLELAGRTFEVEAAPMVRVKTPGGREYAFGSHRGMREFCAETKNGRQSVRAVRVSFRVEPYFRDSRTGRDYCGVTQSAWMRDLCDTPETRDDNRIARFPAFLALLSSGESGEQTLARDGRTSIEVLDDPAWRDSFGKPFSFHCAATGEPGIGRCRTRYPIRDGLDIEYAFVAAQSRLTESAQLVNRQVWRLMAEIDHTP